VSDEASKGEGSQGSESGAGPDKDSAPGADNKRVYLDCLTAPRFFAEASIISFHFYTGMVFRYHYQLSYHVSCVDTR
jgi:hypothetical protein